MMDIRAKLSEIECPFDTTDCPAGTAVAALQAVLDLCDQAPVNDDVGVMFSDEVEHVIAVALGLPGDPRHTAALGVAGGESDD